MRVNVHELSKKRSLHYWRLTHFNGEFSRVVIQPKNAFPYCRRQLLQINSIELFSLTSVLLCRVSVFCAHDMLITAENPT